ncbi:hypothetical protein I545_5020 [Mycobacterium kansasii 662]|uniref:Uncharacterized protein n=2 Tax=Mycobacterium kansasii TaxID=1768 RepID=A0A1V3WWG5_MYCKA|nr:hypothetical protein I547_2731 [Mycobacterium kansasii 824]EUA12597.1 hypothetical protein I545_5020 [Mycobacterium kansasii 662]KEP38967.1 hypothetical protein MKSMC1_59520 [Mycobacterium kansasii]OOK71265.1 hypothetical protein BZL29_5474 [Mycobacterium kansasii]OOK76468.1 hypothetical protein BZL30_3922 [Mycobacterium kansasii]
MNAGEHRMAVVRGAEQVAAVAAARRPERCVVTFRSLAAGSAR